MKMTHLKSTKQRKKFVCKIVSKAKPAKVYKIYKAVERAVGYKPKKRYKRSKRR